MKRWFSLAIALSALAFASCNEQPIEPADPVGVEGVELDIQTLTFVVGTDQTQQLTATVLPHNADNKAVVWSCDNASVAKVDPATGVVSAVGYGTALVTATTREGKHTASCRVLVNIAGTVQSLNLSGEEVPMPWTISDGTLTFDGEGEISSFGFSDETPWDQHMAKFDKVVFSEGITILGHSLFFEHTGLVSVKFPDSLVTIGDNVFYGCSALGSVDFPAGLLLFGLGSFGGCSSLKSVVVPEGITTIENHLFRQCVALESVSLPSTLTSIGQYGFAECPSLRSITIPAGVESINARAFNYCTALKEVIVMATTPPSLVQDVAPSFNAGGDTLYVPKGCAETYRQTNWNEHFDLIAEQE